MFRNLRQFNSLTKPEKHILFLAWKRLWQVRVSLWVCSYRQTLSHIEKECNVNKIKSENLVSSERIADLITAASKWVISPTCLTQALAGKWVLEEAGFNPSFHIGVKKDEKKYFEAHAWLEMNGKKLLGGLAAEGFKQIHRE